MMNVEKNPYADIIHLPHHKAPNRPHMSLYDRAAQFSPFAALTGFDSVIAETARLTDRKVELSESEKILLDQKLTLIDDVIQDKTTRRLRWSISFPITSRRAASTKSTAA